MTDVTNERLYRTITVRGVPKSVAHAVRLLCEVSQKASLRVFLPESFLNSTVRTSCFSSRLLLTMRSHPVPYLVVFRLFGCEGSAF